MFFAYAVVTLDKALLFINPEQVDDKLRQHLGSHTEIKAYSGFLKHLKWLVDDIKVGGIVAILTRTMRTYMSLFCLTVVHHLIPEDPAR